MVGQQINDTRLITILRVVTIILGIGLISLSVYRFTNFDLENPRNISLNLYYIIFGVLLFLSEMPCKSMMSCFSFLGFYIGKAIFCVFLGSITFNPSII